MDAFEAAMRRARELRERAARLDRRTDELVGRTDELLHEIDSHARHTRRRARRDAVDPYPEEGLHDDNSQAAEGPGARSSSAGSAW